ncbi:TonB-dependent receptor plug domain-containing protein [soil metagenome]
MLATSVAAADPDPAPAPTITASGRVIDALGKPVRGATIEIEGGGAKTTSDKQGRYTITAPLGATVVINADKRGIALGSVNGETLDDVVVLSELSNENIEIGGETPIAATGAATLDREEIQRLPGAGGDVVRTLSAMPGVVNTQVPLGYNGIVIRGSSPQDSKVLVDDFEIPILFHALAFRAIVPAETIDTLTFVPGGFAVDYGRSSSGIVLLTTRGGSDKRTTAAEVSLIDGGLVAQGPIDDKTKYMIALRRSVIDFIVPLVIPSSVDLSLTTVPQYWDEQFKIDHEMSSAWKLSISSIGTDDRFELFTTKDEDAGAKRFYARTRFLRLTGAANYHEGEWSAKVALSSLIQEIQAKIGLYQGADIVTSTVTPRASVTRSMAKAWGLKDVVWTAGGEAQVGYSNVDLAIPIERREGEPYPAYDPKDTTSHFTGSVWFPDYAAWTSLEASFDPRIRLTGGLRVDYFGRPHELALEPRSEIQIKLDPTLTARLGAGAYRRPPEFQSEFLQKSVQSERSDQYTMGLEYNPILGVKIQGSLYYTNRSFLITHEADGTLGNNGRGTSKGAELLAIVTNGIWFGWFGYSYSNSERVDAPGAAPRLFDYDQPHSLNVALSHKQGRWQLGGRFSLYSGLPLTPIIGSELDSDRNLHLPVSGPVNSDRAPLHHQLDLRVDYNFTWGPAAMTAYLDLQNVYLDRSVVTYFYGYDYSQRSGFESLPLIPSLGLRGTI